LLLLGSIFWGGFTFAFDTTFDIEIGDTLHDNGHTIARHGNKGIWDMGYGIWNQGKKGKQELFSIYNE